MFDERVWAAYLALVASFSVGCVVKVEEYGADGSPSVADDSFDASSSGVASSVEALPASSDVERVEAVLGAAVGGRWGRKPPAAIGSVEDPFPLPKVERLGVRRAAGR